MPAWDFRERHERTAAATPTAAYDAFRDLRIDEMPLSRVLFAIRSAPSRLTGGTRLPTGSHAPLLDLMLDAGFTLLSDLPGEEIVVGLVATVSRGGAPGGVDRWDAAAAPSRAGSFAAYAQPGAVKMAMSFRFDAEATSGVVPAGVVRTKVVTETRVLATDAGARRHFRAYWLGIRLFSGLIRREWLAAVARRAATGTT